LKYNAVTSKISGTVPVHRVDDQAPRKAKILENAFTTRERYQESSLEAELPLVYQQDNNCTE
jgi:hypothetical protein